jgi:hypothetical protein
MMSLWTSCEATLIHLPIFIPNNYLFTTHADKSQEKWDIYAWAIRDVMAKVGGFEKIDVQCRENWKHDYLVLGKTPRDDAKKNN